MNSVCRQEPPRVALVVKTLSDNSLGRAYSLSLVLDEVGADWAVLSAAMAMPLASDELDPDFA